MKKIIQTLSSIAIVVVCISCSKDNHTPATTNLPVILDFSPTTGEPGTSVSITGKNFNENIAENLVTFADTPAEIISATTTQLMVKVPTGASTGKIKLATNNTTVTSDKDFTVITPVSPVSPVITSFAPTEGRPGSQVTITGTNFSSVIAENTVAIGNQSATVVSASPTALTIIVPNTISGKISVKVNNVTATSVSYFIVIPLPVIDTFAPAGGLAGSSVSFYGAWFSTKPGGNVVKFNNIEAVLTEVTTSKITATVPAGAQTGKVNVIVEGASVFTTTNFTVISKPVINSITPLQGSPGMSITILGENFNSTVYGVTAVVFATNTLATITSHSDNQIIVTVPSGASTGKISVVANQLTKTSVDNFQILPPVISTFTPAHAAVGASITINGSNFSTVSASDNHVKINGTAATITAFSDNQLTILVPAGATGGKISIEVAGNTASSTTDFTVD